jgi:hypothetical protein
MSGLFREKRLIHNFHAESYSEVQSCLYLEVFRYKYQSGHLIEVFFYVSLCLQFLKLEHYHSLPHPSSVIICTHSTICNCVTSARQKAH